MDRRVKDVLDRLAVDWRRTYSVPDLAASVNLGPSRLEHLFRESLRMSIRDVVRTRRITEAAHLLLTTHKRVSEISRDVGFTDISNFNHAFRRQFGVCPRDYRKRGGDGGEGE
jgi:transcriptional regulator GlxA family with amidase domain